MTSDSDADLAHSVFVPECPHCGVALQPVAGWIWRCPTCTFVAERVAGMLLELGHDAIVTDRRLR